MRTRHQIILALSLVMLLSCRSTSTPTDEASPDATPSSTAQPSPQPTSTPTEKASPRDRAMGDVNGDGVANLFDLVAVSVRWDQEATDGVPEDLNADGQINLFDLVAVAANYERSVELPGGATAEPTPTPLP